jgi:acyl-CoA reductase-like NAD-dependent aldehyde dehydrogenase
MRRETMRRPVFTFNDPVFASVTFVYEAAVDRFLYPLQESGLGREGGSKGLDEFTDWKYVCMGGLALH